MTKFRIHSLSNMNPDLFESSFGELNNHIEFVSKDSLRDHKGNKNHFTVVIGKNGVGKSRSIAKIAEMFASASDQQIGLQKRLTHARKNLNEWAIEYSINETFYELSFNGINSKIVALSPKNKKLAIPPLLPNKIIALATTATDKFPVNRADQDDHKQFDEYKYNYIGFKGRFGSSNSTNAMQRALEALIFSNRSSKRRSHVSQIFEYLGYRPEIRHIYRWRFSLAKIGSTVKEILSYEDDGGYFLQKVKDKLTEIINSDPNQEENINNALINFLERQSKGQISFRSDFGKSGRIDQREFINLQTLKSIGILSFDTIELWRNVSERSVDFREISSGELSILTSFLGLSATIEDGSLILIDEPEVSLHPEWQSNYLPMLSEYFSSYSGCHFVIATHSPLILSSAPKGLSNTLRIGYEDDEKNKIETYGGESSDEVLLKAFRSPGQNNLYLKQLTIEALRILSNEDSDFERLNDILDEISPVIDTFAPGEPIRELLQELLSVKSQVMNK